jgi:hypothetical protein
MSSTDLINLKRNYCIMINVRIPLQTRKKKQCCLKVIQTSQVDIVSLFPCTQIIPLHIHNHFRGNRAHLFSTLSIYALFESLLFRSEFHFCFFLSLNFLLFLLINLLKRADDLKLIIHNPNVIFIFGFFFLNSNFHHLMLK